MSEYALINKKIVRHNSNLKSAFKNAKRTYTKGSRKPLKNYLGKAVQLSSDLMIGNEERISNFVKAVTSDELLLKLKKSNITGMSGNGYFVSDKIERFITANSDKRILIINAVECDPGLIHDEWLLKNRYTEIVHAIDYLKQSLTLDRVVLATKNKNVKKGLNYSAITVPARYPLGEEHFLIEKILNIKIAKKQYPTDFGILVLNIQSVYQICKIINNCYDEGRFITIADLSNAKAKAAYVYPSDRIIEVLQKAYGYNEKKLAYKGTGIMSCSIVNDDDNFSFIGNFAVYAKAPEIDNANKCRGCHMCDIKCPAGIKVSKLVRELDKEKSNGLLDMEILQKCIQCGSCTYYCMASKNVSSYITAALKTLC